MNNDFPPVAAVGGVQAWPEELRDAAAEESAAFAMPWSPSSIALVKKCARKMALEKIDRAPKAEFQYRADGVEGHAHLEHYLRTGDTPRQDTKMGRIAAVGLSELPPPKLPGVGVEVGFMMRRPGGLTYRGYIDVAQLCPTPEHPTMAFIGDYKFVSAKTYDTYAMQTSAELLADDAFAIYAGWLTSAWVGVDSVGAMWYYFIKDPKNPKCKPTPVVATSEQIEKRLNEIDAVARLGVLIRLQYKRANDVPHNANVACKGIGSRCEYREHCDIANPGIQPADLLKKRKDQDHV